MLAVIAKLDGANGLLFHMEPWSGRWQYRVRFPASESEALREWGREREVEGAGVFFALSDPNTEVAAQWREPDGEWRDAAAHEFADTEADFAVELRARRDFRRDPVLRVAGLVRGWVGVFDLELPRRVLAEHGPERFRARGRSHLPGPGSVLREPGDLTHRCEAWSVTNLGPNRQAALLPVAAAVPGSSGPRQAVMVKAGALSEPERQALLDWVEAQPAAPEPAAP